MTQNRGTAVVVLDGDGSLVVLELGAVALALVGTVRLEGRNQSDAKRGAEAEKNEPCGNMCHCLVVSFCFGAIDIQCGS